MGDLARAWTKKCLLLTFLLLFFALLQGAYATNGMNIIGYGPLGTGIGGADVAIRGACSPIASNPANLIHTCEKSASIGMSFLYPRIRLKADSIGNHPGNNRAAKRHVFTFPFASTAVKLNQWIGVGIGIFAQGGMGVNFQDLHTIFGTRDEIKSQVRFARISPTLVFSPTEKLSLGASLRLGYADVGYKLLPNTSSYNESMAFMGQELRHAASTTFSISVGVNYRVSTRLSLGVDFISQSSLDLRGGKLVVNMNSIGKGLVRYDGSVDNFTWPAELRCGLAYQVSRRIRLAFEVRHIWWRDALGIIKVTGRDPHGALSEVGDFYMEFPFKWQNQWVFALGSEIQISKDIMLRMGFNHGNKPIPSKYLTPLFPATVEDHVSLGFRWACPCVRGISVDISYIHAFKTEDSMAEGGMIFGENAKISHEQDTIGVFFTKSF